MFGVIEGTGFEAIEPEFNDCLIGHARVERLWTGARWSEGPVWNAAGRYLVWSDIPNNRMLRFDDTDGTVSEFRAPSNNSNGNTVDRQGRMITCEHLTRRVTRTEFDGSITVIADRFEGKRFNSPNDVVVKSDGSIWFTDPSYGILMDYEGARAESEIGACHVYRVAPDGQISIVAQDYVKPNGLAFSADESLLYIADTGITTIRKARVTSAITPLTAMARWVGVRSLPPAPKAYSTDSGLTETGASGAPQGMECIALTPTAA